MTPEEIVIVEYEPKYGSELVRMWRDSFERAVGVVDFHPIAEQLQYFEEKVVVENHVLVVLERSSTQVIGFLASTPEKISQLYVGIGHQKKGIGSMLLDIAKQRSNGRLRLFTFKANSNARKFYEKHGFKIIARRFEEEWKLEDLEYEWSATLDADAGQPIPSLNLE